MRTEMKTETRWHFVPVLVASVIAVVTFTAPQAWQSMLTQVVSPATAAERYFYRPTVRSTQTGEKVVSVGVATANGVAIPDNNAKGINIPIEIKNPHPGDSVITQVDLYLDIKHEFVHDLTAVLTSPDGHTVRLWNSGELSHYDNKGGEYCSREGLKITLVETAPEAKRLHGSECPSAKRRETGRTHNGVFYYYDTVGGDGRLEGLYHTRGKVLQQFNGRVAHGIWTLTVADGCRKRRPELHGPYICGTGSFQNAHLTVVSKRN